MRKSPQNNSSIDRPDAAPECTFHVGINVVLEGAL